MNELITEFKQFKENVEGKVDRVSADLAKLEGRINRPVSSLFGGGADQHEVGSLAKVLSENDGFKSWSKTAKGRFAIEVPGEMLTKAITSATLGLTSGTVPNGIAAPGVRKRRVRSLLRVTPTNLAAVPFAKETAFTNAAYPAPETTAKGESSLTVQAALALAVTVAHWTKVPKQAMDDLAILRGYIDGRLLNGLGDQEDFELLRGDGMNGHLTGLILSATAYETARNVSGDTKLDKLGHALSQLEEGNYEATGFVLNPADWRTISLVKTEDGGANTGTYVMGGPSGSPDKQLWGIPVATTNAMPTGKFLAGDFATAAEVFERMSAVVEVSDSHDTFFVENMLAVRCEERIALAIYRGDAMVYGSY